MTADDEKSPIDSFFEQDHPNELSQQGPEPGKAEIKWKDRLLETPATTSSLSLNDPVTELDDEGDVLSEVAQSIIDHEANKKDS